MSFCQICFSVPFWYLKKLWRIEKKILKNRFLLFLLEFVIRLIQLNHFFISIFKVIPNIVGHWHQGCCETDLEVWFNYLVSHFIFFYFDLFAYFWYFKAVIESIKLCLHTKINAEVFKMSQILFSLIFLFFHVKFMVIEYTYLYINIKITI